MKKTFTVVVSMILVLAMVFGLAACGTKTETPAPAASASPAESPAETPAEAPVVESLGTVRYGIHPNSSAFSAGFLLSELKLNEKYNFDIEMTVTTGPNVFSALAAGEMDIGFLGNGMAWHYFEDDAKIAILTIDNLTNDDRLLVRTGLGIEPYAPIDVLYEKLPGLTMALDLTTTPGTFLKSLINAINEGRDDADKLWYEDVEKAYPLKGSADKEIIIMNTTNSNITAVMQDPSVDCCITYGNTKAILQNDTENYAIAATTFTHLSNTVTPSTWAVNKEFAEKNPELVQAFVNALVDAMDFRSDEANWPECIQLAIPFDQLSEEDYDSTAAHWLSKAELTELFATPDSQGYTYLNQIRNSHMGNNGLEDATAPAANEVILDQFIKTATGTM